MAQSTDNVVDQVAQLNAARSLVLGDAALYPQIVNGVLPIVGANARLELRRWGADFLAETFASPILATAQKQQLAPTVLQSIQETLALPETDTAVLSSLVQTSASLYPLIFRHIVNHPEDSKTWETMNAVKEEILRKMDSFPFPARICSVKFLQRVVQVQTPGLIADPRRPDQNETSLAVVPRNHALLAIPHLEAEASGLLDRLLGVFQEETSDPLIVNATLNCLAPLIRTRQSIANKIIQTILDFFPAKHVRPPFTPTVRVGVKSMERTARALLFNLMKKNPSHPLMGRMQAYIERLMQSRLEVTEEASRKRGLPVEPTDGLDHAKRARLDAMTPPLLKIPPLPPGPTSYDQLFTLTQDTGLSSFDVKQLPPDLVVKIVVPLLAQVNPSLLNQAVDAIRNRYETITKEQNLKRQQLHQAAVAAAADGDDDYEPDYEPLDVGAGASEDAVAIATEDAELEPDLVSLGPFVLPQPPPLTEEEAGDVGRSAVSRVFGMIDAVETTPSPAQSKTQQQLGFTRLAGSTFDRDAWVILLTRLATRAPAGLEGGDKFKGEIASGKRQPTISDSIRETLYRYILEDFRGRLKIGITWLNEEWYNDRVRMKAASSERGEEDEEPTVALFYDTWVLRLLDGFLPYLDSRDIKVLVRFLSEIPEVTIAITQRVASLAKDPERVNLTVQALMYLIMFRPPAREICLNTLEDIYQTYEESRPAAGKVLARWRPQALPAPAETAPAPSSVAASAPDAPQAEVQPPAASI
ncbi:mRNA cleavage and polyadenylation specificity factor complex subunit pta1 [Penicillium rolfsii]|nr:mRNA cleavage and polyadenylation specificity factor complex subunit pta1 [Penicillium rolfsii]